MQAENTETSLLPTALSANWMPIYSSNPDKEIQRILHSVPGRMIIQIHRLSAVVTIQIIQTIIFHFKAYLTKKDVHITQVLSCQTEESDQSQQW